MKNTYLVITSIAGADHPVLKLFAKQAFTHGFPLIVIGDSKSPSEFELPHCDFYSIERQKTLQYALAHLLPLHHYARKNLGYLVAMMGGAEVIIETDDDNLPLSQFWMNRKRATRAHTLTNNSWVNVYKYFTNKHIWPRGFSLEHILDAVPDLNLEQIVDCPIQQGLANDNPDVDAMYRMSQPLPVSFETSSNIALGQGSYCPFNSQNTTWFKEAFPLLYLPSYCSFRMTDIWRSFVAQRIAWECDWYILFHQSTVWQERNDHDLLKDFKDEIPGYLNNNNIMKEFEKLSLQQGINNISSNLLICYQKLIDMGLVESKEIKLLEAWTADIRNIGIG